MPAIVFDIKDKVDLDLLIPGRFCSPRFSESLVVVELEHLKLNGVLPLCVAVDVVNAYGVVIVLWYLITVLVFGGIVV